MRKEYSSLGEFYVFYLTQHEHRGNRRMHFIGTTLFLATAAYMIFSGRYELLLLLPVVGYGPAWIGHFFIEKNVPATFTYPFYSFACDFIMYKDMLAGKLSF